ncbi:alpha/beta hydrolase [Hufsiella ginkgonis]|uniref:Alpha/beta hydrolase fold domain-containing protein n=1 Tax=Hufsiella ginkgonis TaxID=2695274 RepID=A0A7K1XYF3_9SPHI|nr:alpha/beta hydrolase [Hufsiella ginkgonis]MXV16025.1 alpha/beta hydrolase fold domain-containing protein [Hufsiella ginkgonis]
MKTTLSKSILLAFAVPAMVAMLASCAGSGTKPAGDSSAVMTDSTATDTVIAATGPKPAWGETIEPEMHAVIEKLAEYGDKPIPELTPAEARKNHTPTDAVMDLISEHHRTIPPPMCDTTGKEIPVNGGTVHARVYTPKTGAGPFPVIVYYHGGGFVIANIDVYNASAQGLSDLTGAIVVSVAYRLAPEHKFPTAHNDAFAAYKWVTENASSMKGDPKKIAVVGESAGGNLAANVSIMARDKGITVPVYQVLIYPIAQSDMNTPAYIKYAAAKPLDKPMMEWFTRHYLNSMTEAKDPRISLVMANLRNLPSTTIITAEIDPLNSDGMMLADKLKAAGVSVDSKNYTGVTHEFFGMPAIVPQAKDAQQYAADALKKAFGK